MLWQTWLDSNIGPTLLCLHHDNPNIQVHSSIRYSYHSLGTICEMHTLTTIANLLTLHLTSHMVSLHCRNTILLPIVEYHPFLAPARSTVKGPDPPTRHNISLHYLLMDTITVTIQIHTRKLLKLQLLIQPTPLGL